MEFSQIRRATIALFSLHFLSEWKKNKIRIKNELLSCSLPWWCVSGVWKICIDQGGEKYSGVFLQLITGCSVLGGVIGPVMADPFLSRSIKSSHFSRLVDLFPKGLEFFHKPQLNWHQYKRKTAFFTLLSVGALQSCADVTPVLRRLLSALITLSPHLRSFSLNLTKLTHLPIEE